VAGERLDTVVYWLDASDRIVRIGDTWTSFAVLNDAPELAEPAVLGASIWPFIADSTTKNIYRSLLQRVRDGGTARFAYRCDGPSIRREMEMHLVQEGALARFESRVVRWTPRPPQALFDRHAPRGADWVRACGWCNRLHVGDLWLEVEAAVPALGLFEAEWLPALTHVICPDCAHIMKDSSRFRERTP